MEKLPIDDVREPPLQAAQCFPVTLSGSAFPLVVRAAGCVSTDLGNGHGVQGAVQLPVSGAGKTVADDVAGGRLDRRGAGVAGERGGRTEPVDRTDPSEDLARVQRSDPAQLGQRGAGFGDRRLDVAGCLAIRRSSCRISPTRSTARPRMVLPARSRSRTRRSISAARAALRPRGAPAGIRWVSTTCSRLTVWVRVLTRSSRCSTIARSGDRGISPGNG